tara:strand:+ start:525 stop:1343 length:819 start_codon:yes stop_codon:yes gene_type:complete
MIKIKINDFEISNNLPFILIAGPCVVENKNHSIDIAGKINDICKKLNINFIFKSSFDKANRTSIDSIRGLGLEESLNVFAEIKKNIKCPIITDVHTKEQCKEVSNLVDILQIPAFLCRQTDLLIAAGKTNKIINVKKGQFLSPYEVPNIIEKILSTNNNKIMLTERGTFFGYNNLVNDFRSIPIMRKTKYPVVFDATHSVQEPGGKGSSSGGKREFVPILSNAAVAIGVAGIFLETHNDPDNAPSDGPNMLKISDLEELLLRLKDLDSISKK